MGISDEMQPVGDLRFGTHAAPKYNVNSALEKLVLPEINKE